jgi:tyrosinase
MVFVRSEVRSLGPGWNETLLWYAKAVKAMRAKPVTDKTSWAFLGGCHGFDQAVWISFGYLGQTSPLPAAGIRNRFWDQCQHQSWYFLPWHRGYLASFEWIVRDQVIKLGGPKDWALPYWNYSDTSIANAKRIPSAFSTATMPDGSSNPLFSARRYGAGAPAVVLTDPTVALTAMAESRLPGLADP